MPEKIFRFDLDGKEVLGFDTSLDAQAFAQAKMAQFITQSGFLVFPNGKTEPWKAEGVYENPGQNDKPGTMIVWGTSFPGVSLDSLVMASLASTEDKAKDQALDALRHWLKAKAALGEDKTVYPGAAGVLVVCNTTDPNFPAGTVLFPPDRLVKRAIEAGGDDEVLQAQQWYHPDLKGKDSTSFSAAVMAYTIFCGAVPYASEQAQKDGDVLRQDMREGVFIPPSLAAPGLDNELVNAISAAMEPIKTKGEVKIRPAPEILKNLLGDSGPRKVASFFTPVGEEERTRIKNELTKYSKKRNFTVKSRRFVIRNTTIIVICLIAAVGIGLTVRGYLVRLAERPNTQGMTPVEVVNVYYGSFETLDHEMMEACIYGKNAKLDIDFILNLYVLTRSMMAYEGSQRVVSAREWLAAGSPQTDLTIFGITDLSLRPMGGNESQGVIILEASYKLWLPAAFMDDADTLTDEELFSSNYVTPPPGNYSYLDRLTLTLVKDAWRITEINRTQLR
ncbi:MAG: hypothetical protein LBI14_00470 [Treponema sp.]|jgi:hypothetical protein|nr:hypothetical protein [Treponema sp.]